MIRINLARHEVTDRSPLRVSRTALIGFGVLGLLVVVHIVKARVIASLEKQRQTLLAEISTLDIAAAAEKAPLLEETPPQLQADVAAIAGRLRSLATIMPAHLWLTDYQEHQAEGVIVGLARSPEDIREFVNRLSRLPSFSAVELTQMGLRRAEPQTPTDSVLHEFTLTTRLADRSPLPESDAGN